MITYSILHWYFWGALIHIVGCKSVQPPIPPPRTDHICLNNHSFDFHSKLVWITHSGISNQIKSWKCCLHKYSLPGSAPDEVLTRTSLTYNWCSTMNMNTADIFWTKLTSIELPLKKHWVWRKGVKMKTKEHLRNILWKVKIR